MNKECALNGAGVAKGNDTGGSQGIARGVAFQ